MATNSGCTGEIWIGTTETGRSNDIEIAGPIACPMGAGNRACDDEWSQLEIDLGVTGPTCGPLASDAGDFVRPEKQAAGGCGCEAGGASWGVAIAVAWFLRRRGCRRRRER